MGALIVFILVMLVVATAVAAPWAWMGGDRRREADALAMGSALLGGGCGIVGLGLAVYFHAAGEGYAETAVALFAYSSLLPVLGAVVGLHAALRSRSRLARRALLVAASVLTLAGAPMVVVFSVGGMLAVLAALGYLAALCSPRDVLRKLDPRF